VPRGRLVAMSDIGGDPVSRRRETAVQPGTLSRPELTVADRCDRCGAAAKVRAVLPSGGELLFCGHHARAHSEKLRELDVDLQSGA
jgi:hypothetical protein